MAKNEEEVKNSVFGFGESNEAFAEFFKGTSYLKELALSKEAKTAVHNVSFEPGCRNNWHKHSVPQILIAVAGEGWYQEACTKDGSWGCCNCKSKYQTLAWCS